MRNGEAKAGDTQTRGEQNLKRTRGGRADEATPRRFAFFERSPVVVHRISGRFEPGRRRASSPHLAFGDSASSTFTFGPLPWLSTAPLRFSIASAPEDALSNLTYATVTATIPHNTPQVSKTQKRACMCATSCGADRNQQTSATGGRETMRTPAQRRLRPSD